MRLFLLLACFAAVNSAPVPPCTSPLNPAFESICYTTVSSSGNYSVRDFASGVNVSLITTTYTSPYGGWAQLAGLATQEMLIYFEGENSALRQVPRTVPLIFRPTTGSRGGLSASMALPTSVYPNPANAPRPSSFVDVLEPFPAIRIAALSFQTPELATDIQYSFACGELQEILTLQGITPVAGPWSQAWVTYSGRASATFVNECWIEVEKK
jgi:hypothetical protein